MSQYRVLPLLIAIAASIRGSAPSWLLAPLNFTTVVHDLVPLNWANLAASSAPSPRNFTTVGSGTIPSSAIFLARRGLEPH